MATAKNIDFLSEEKLEQWVEQGYLDVDGERIPFNPEDLHAVKFDSNLTDGEGQDSIVQKYTGEVDGTHFGNTNTGESAVVFGEANTNMSNRSLLTGKMNNANISAPNSIIGGLGNGRGISASPYLTELSGENILVCGTLNSNYYANNVIVSGNYNLNDTNKYNAIVSGDHNINRTSNALVIGRYNAPEQDAYLLVGNGSSNDQRSNAFIVYTDGRATAGRSTTAADANNTLVTKDFVDKKSDIYQAPIYGPVDTSNWAVGTDVEGVIGKITNLDPVLYDTWFKTSDGQELYGGNNTTYYKSSASATPIMIWKEGTTYEPDFTFTLHGTITVKSIYPTDISDIFDAMRQTGSTSVDCEYLYKNPAELKMYRHVIAIPDDPGNYGFASVPMHINVISTQASAFNTIGELVNKVGDIQDNLTMETNGAQPPVFISGHIRITSQEIFLDGLELMGENVFETGSKTFVIGPLWPIQDTVYEI